ncbi:hypothetical protein AB0B66_09810 [Catellatospora sp. NPDC049111]|uniref:hypothetical protein n=1 Tax=Catellatospora sp. NPDC049111 TaxID=3155271 RepID=UPI0033E43071
MTAPDQQKLTENAYTVLATFILRARRVEAHSLAADRTRLLDWAQGKAKLTVRTDGGPAELAIDLPEEEALDSLAARCRPFILNNETVYHAKVMNALGYLTRGEQDLADKLQTLKAGWRRLDPSTKTALAYDSQTGPVGGRLGAPVTDVALAYAWLYGDLVHADDITDRVASHDIDARYQGAALVIANVAVEVIKTMGLIRLALNGGVLTLDPKLFTERVTVRTSIRQTLAAVALGPIGTPREVLERILDEQAAAAFTAGTEGAATDHDRPMALDND